MLAVGAELSDSAENENVPVAGAATVVPTTAAKCPDACGSVVWTQNCFLLTSFFQTKYES